MLVVPGVATVMWLIVLPGAAHALVFGRNRHQLWHTVDAFLTMPPRRDRQ